MQGVRVGLGRRDDRFATGWGGRVGIEGLQLGHGDTRPQSAPRDANRGWRQSHAGGDPRRPRPRGRRHAELRRCPALVAWRLRRHRNPGVPQRGDGRGPAYHVRGQGPSAISAGGDGPLIRIESAPQVLTGGDGGAQGELVFVLDFGSQTAQLIARRVREASVYCELVPGTTPWSELKARRPVGVILSGGPASVYEEGAPQVDPELLRSGVPVLGICYGMQLIAHHLGGEVASATKREYGPAVLAVDHPGELFAGLPSPLPVSLRPGDQVVRMPAGFHPLASSDNAPLAAFSDGAGVVGIQFHPEVHHTPHGGDVLRNFLYRVCGCTGTWTADSFIADATRSLRATVG